MIKPATMTPTKTVRYAIYTRKSHEEGLDQAFNSLDAQRESCEAYIAAQRHEGWTPLPDRFDDGGYSGGTMDRPGLQRLIGDIQAGRVDCVVVYKIDRLSRSLLDSAKLLDTFSAHDVSFVSVTQQFNTATSGGRMMMNTLLTFAQFEREVIGERIRDKVAQAKRRGKHCGGTPILGYDIDSESRLVVNPQEAELVKTVFKRFIQLGSCLRVAKELNSQGHRTKSWTTKKGVLRQGHAWDKTQVHRILVSRTYIGEVTHKDQVYKGEHEAVVDRATWDRIHATLQTNGHQRATETRQKTPALLRGILRCGHCGTSMGVTFTSRHGRQYRYYLCGHAGKNGYDACPVPSVAAGEIEAAVVEQLRRVFRSPEVVARTHRTVQASAEGDQPSETEVATALRNIDPLWDSLFPAEQEHLVRLLVKQVDINPDGLVIQLRTEGLRSLVAELQDMPKD
jgi:site-specific DNA recombinase